jgi:hypothetical protein
MRRMTCGTISRTAIKAAESKHVVNLRPRAGIYQPDLMIEFTINRKSNIVYHSIELELSRRNVSHLKNADNINERIVTTGADTARSQSMFSQGVAFICHGMMRAHEMSTVRFHWRRFRKHSVRPLGFIRSGATHPHRRVSTERGTLFESTESGA